MTMQADEIERLIAEALPDCTVAVEGSDGHFTATVVGERFAGQLPVARQKAVYATVTEQITSGAIHALTIRAQTPQEWEKAQKLRIG